MCPLEAVGRQVLKEESKQKDELVKDNWPKGIKIRKFYQNTFAFCLFLLTKNSNREHRNIECWVQGDAFVLLKEA